MATQKDANVYPEAVEAAENKGGGPKEIRNARVADPFMASLLLDLRKIALRNTLRNKTPVIA